MYTCYHRIRKLNNCNGQSVYNAKRIDNMVLGVVKNYLEKIKTTPKDKALELRYEKEVSEKKKLVKNLTTEKERIERRLTELSVEVGKCLNGESAFTTDVLTMSINSTKDELNSIQKRLTECEKSLEEKNDVLNKLDYYYTQFTSWADEFDTATMEQKKMIICQLIKEIRVFKDYNIEIEFNISYRQFLVE